MMKNPTPPGGKSPARPGSVPARLKARANTRRPALSRRIAAAVRRSLGTPRLRVEARRVRATSTSGFTGWRIRLHERRRISDSIDLAPPAIVVIRKLGLVPPEYHGDLRIALAGIREDWRED